MPVLLAASTAHLINDVMQSVLLSIYPMVREPLGLDYVQIGVITLVFQLTASILQPMVGLATDRHPRPFSLPVGMAISAAGVLLVALAADFWTLLLAAALIGVGSSIFHPEASRVARLASGGRYGFAQSLFQVGGNSGQALAPLLVALLVYPYGQGHAAWFALLAGVGFVLLVGVGRWYRAHLLALPAKQPVREPAPVARNQVWLALFVLLTLTFSKNVYMAAFASYYTFFLIERFAVSVQAAQLHLFVFLGAVAAGTMLGGPIGDRIGRKPVLWLSIVGVLPFSLAIPFLPLPLTVLAAIVAGILMASAFPTIVVYAQDLLPGRVGLVGGLFFGFAFGMGGIGAVLVGALADFYGLRLAFILTGAMPALGLLVAFLPDLDRLGARASRVPVQAPRPQAAP
ncbi:MAG: MFS transporter [Pseudomonadota bacterium]